MRSFPETSQLRGETSYGLANLVASLGRFSRAKFANPPRIPHHYCFVQGHCALTALLTLNPHTNC